MMNKASIMIGNKDSSGDKILFKGKDFTQDEIEVIDQISESNNTPREDYIPLENVIQNLNKSAKALKLNFTDGEIKQMKKALSAIADIFARFSKVLSETVSMVVSSDEFQNILWTMKDLNRKFYRTDIKAIIYNQDDFTSYPVDLEWCNKLEPAQEEKENSSREDLEPDWSPINERWNWMAIDKNGDGYLYEKKPIYDGGYWDNTGDGQIMFYKSFRVDFDNAVDLIFKRPE